MGTFRSQFSSLKPDINKSVKCGLKMHVLSHRGNINSDDEALIVGGGLFHALAAATGKVRSPSVMRRVDGMTSDTVLAKRS